MPTTEHSLKLLEDGYWVEHERTIIQVCRTHPTLEILSTGEASDLARAFEEQRAEIHRLQGIVDKLPKTADGVLAVPGTPYVFVGQWGHVYEGVVETKPYYISKCYSTREAAKAKEER